MEHPQLEEISLFNRILGLGVPSSSLQGSTDFHCLGDTRSQIAMPGGSAVGCSLLPTALERRPLAKNEQDTGRGILQQRRIMKKWCPDSRALLLPTLRHPHLLRGEPSGRKKIRESVRYLARERPRLEKENDGG